jgi:hypothetical protein
VNELYSLRIDWRDEVRRHAPTSPRLACGSRFNVRSRILGLFHFLH